MVPLIGHDRNKKYFKNVIKNGALAHAYLFTGPDMIGKKSFATELYTLINGRESGNDPDFVLVASDVIEDESKIYIEDVRKLRSFFRLKPYTGPCKFALIDDAHSLTPEAANALLKILEEPPGFSVLVLVSSMPGLIPATIVSRCERVRFSEVNEKEAGDYLAGPAYRQAGKKLKQEDKEFLIKLAGGRIGLMNRILEGDGLQDAHKAVDDLRKLFNSGIFEKMNYAKKVHEKGDYQPKVDYWLSWVSAHLQNSPKNEKIVKNLLSLSQLISQPQYNHRLALENFLLNL